MLKTDLELFITSLAILFYWSTPLKNVRFQYNHQSLNMGKFSQLLLALEQTICYTCNPLSSFRKAHRYLLDPAGRLTYWWLTGPQRYRRKSNLPKRGSDYQTNITLIMGSDYSFHGSNFLRRKHKVVLFSTNSDLLTGICTEDLKHVFKWYEKITSEDGEQMFSISAVVSSRFNRNW